MATGPYLPTVREMANHVSNCLKAHRARFARPSTHPPLFVGVQGPQGSGKTFLTSHLSSSLADPPYSLAAAVLSIDDLYLPHAGLTALSSTHPRNRLLHGRGQPGTHDIELGQRVLGALKTINEDTGTEMGSSEVALPVFDKSLYGGAGDRAPETRVARAPLDVVVLEGWCVGFYPVPRTTVETRWARGVSGLEGVGFEMRETAELRDVFEVNEMLEAYVGWWEMLDAFVQIRGPPTAPLAIIYQWRLQQEREMKARNGGRGMTDEQVRTFVDRYIPGYVFFGDGVTEGMVGKRGERRAPPWQGNGLVLELDLERQLEMVNRAVRRYRYRGRRNWVLLGDVFL